MPRGLDGYFIKYGITKSDLQIIESTCNVNEIEPDWLKEEILAPYQARKNEGKTVDANATYRIVRDALNKL
jgi:hypothetical protein